jgi:hypothetical protein
MQQTIKPIGWLESTLWGLRVWDIFENTTSEVENDEGDEIWTCNLAFKIPIRNNIEVLRNIIVPTRPRSLTKVGT